MTVNREFLHSFSTHVDQPQSMLLARGEGELRDTSVGRAIYILVAWKVHLAVDQVVVGCRLRSVVGFFGHCLFDKRIVIFMVPVAQDYWAEVDIVVYILGTVDDHGTGCATCILCTWYKVSI
jgi:hypothetical protein